MIHTCRKHSVHIFAIKKVLTMLDFLKLFALSLSSSAPQEQIRLYYAQSFLLRASLTPRHVVLSSFNDFTRRGQLVFTIDIVAGNTLFVMGNPNSM